MFIINFIRWIIFGKSDNQPSKVLTEVAYHASMRELSEDVESTSTATTERKKRGRPAKAQWLYDTLECLELTGGGYIINTDKWPIKGTPSSAPINAYFASRGNRKYSVKKAGDKTYSITLIQK